MANADPLGRRERKKAATRKTIVDAATELFLARGFDDVSVREIADKADVSPTTVFAHFPQKEALLFGDEATQHERLVSAIRDRPAGTSISTALRDHYRAELAEMASRPNGARVLKLMESTPSLMNHASRMWLRHEDALADAVAQELGRAEPSDEVRVYVRFALQIPLLASDSADPDGMLSTGFRVLDQGWDAYATQAAPPPR
ncbi:TetR/AcrR family transcriptional regulator [Promicromonospora sp. NPDC057138]|uniref:TetR/AcrR family transcriptional regulator n=1 Tax=Promicromonospora sp. NPDC057138 TaxID=3346031 RepID=UPI0036272485